MIMIVTVAVELVIGFAFAMVMHRVIFARGAIRTSILIPYGIITVVSGFAWQFAFSNTNGFVNGWLPFVSDDFNWFSEYTPSMITIMASEIWKTTPFMSLLLLAGLALVPEDLLRAAQVDGAGAWKRLIKVTIPLIKPAILVALLFRTLDAFRIFDNIYVLTAGSNNTGSVSILGYDNLFKAFNVGLGSAISVLIFLSVALIAFIFIKGFGAAAPGADEGSR
jgi:trehalose/maltose transport system permease protein